MRRFEGPHGPDEEKEEEEAEAETERDELYSTESPEWRRAEQAALERDLIDILLRMRQMMGMERQREARYNDGYDFFPYDDERKELVKYCSAIAEYLRDEKVADLIVVDRSARPLYVGVKEYWGARYPKERPPNIKFMNPKGFKAAEDLSFEEAENISEDAMFKDDLYESPLSIRTKDEIRQELQDTYSELLKDKDKPVLVFDTCIHTGKSLRPMLDSLEEAGFSDIRVGAVTPADRTSEVKTDFHITEGVPTRGCYPFDKDRIIEKTFDHVYSLPTRNPRQRERSVALRKEIKRIMQESLQAENAGKD